LKSPELSEKIKKMVSIAHPVELGVRLKELVYPVLKMYQDAIVTIGEQYIEPDPLMCMSKFVVSVVA
jgi:hypothetical protein